MTDFSATLVRASCLYNVMTDGRAKTPYQKWEEAVEALPKVQERYNTYKSKEGKMAVLAAKRIRELTEAIPDLELHKDDEVLSEGCKSYLAKLYASEKYGKWSTFKDKGNKYTVKGKMAEEEAISMISRLDSRAYVKNDVRVSNDFISGVPDIVIGDDAGAIRHIIDVKCPYDIETFIANLSKELNPQYWWQIQAYMWLTEAKTGEISFCLMNTPDYLLNGERNRLFDRMEATTMQDIPFKEAEERLINNLTFDDMPLAERRIKFFVERDDEALSKVPKKIAKCREYLTEIEELHLNGISISELIEI